MLQLVRNNYLQKYRNGHHIHRNDLVGTVMALCLPLYTLVVCQQVSDKACSYILGMPQGICPCWESVIFPCSVLI